MCLIDRAPHMSYLNYLLKPINDGYSTISGSPYSTMPDNSDDNRDVFGGRFNFDISMIITQCRRYTQ